MSTVQDHNKKSLKRKSHQLLQREIARPEEKEENDSGYDTDAYELPQNNVYEQFSIHSRYQSCIAGNEQPEFQSQPHMYQTFMSFAACMLIKEFQAQRQKWMLLDNVVLADRFIQIVAWCMIRVSVDLHEVTPKHGYPSRTDLTSLSPFHQGNYRQRSRKNGLGTQFYVIRGQMDTMVTPLNCTYYPQLETILQPLLQTFKVGHVRMDSDDGEEPEEVLIGTENLWDWVRVGRSSVLITGKPSVLNVPIPPNYPENIICLRHTGADYQSQLPWKMEMGEVLKKILSVSSSRSSARQCPTHLAFHLYWVFANLVPFKRGSASAAKVVLNAALVYMGFQPVQETKEYARQADWVAFTKANVQDFLEQVDTLFTIDEAPHKILPTASPSRLKFKVSRNARTLNLIPSDAHAVAIEVPWDQQHSP